MNGIRDIGEAVGNTVLERVGRVMGRAQEQTPLPVDLLESEDAYLAVFDAPGATMTDLQALYRDGGVEVRVDRFREYHEGFEMRYPGRGLALDGRVDLPADARVDATAATATLRDNGTLEVRVPKVDGAEDHAEEGDDADADERADDADERADDADERADDADERADDES